MTHNSNYRIKAKGTWQLTKSQLLPNPRCVLSIT